MAGGGREGGSARGERDARTLVAVAGRKRLRNWRPLTSYRVGIELGFGKIMGGGGLSGMSDKRGGVDQGGAQAHVQRLAKPLGRCLRGDHLENYASEWVPPAPPTDVTAGLEMG